LLNNGTTAAGLINTWSIVPCLSFTRRLLLCGKISRALW